MSNVTQCGLIVQILIVIAWAWRARFSVETENCDNSRELRSSEAQLRLQTPPVAGKTECWACSLNT